MEVAIELPRHLHRMQIPASASADTIRKRQARWYRDNIDSSLNIDSVLTPNRQPAPETREGESGAQSRPEPSAGPSESAAGSTGPAQRAQSQPSPQSSSFLSSIRKLLISLLNAMTAALVVVSILPVASIASRAYTGALVLVAGASLERVWRRASKKVGSLSPSLSAAKQFAAEVRLASDRRESPSGHHPGWFCSAPLSTPPAILSHFGI